MKFRIRGFEEEYEDYEKCKLDLITMQESAKGDILGVIRHIIADMDEGFDKQRMNLGFNFIIDSLEHTELGFEIDDDGVAYMVEDYIETIRE